MPVDIWSVSSAEAEAMRGRLSRASREFVQTVTDELTSFGEILQNELYEASPFDEGLLRESIAYEVQGANTKNATLVVTMGTGEGGDRPDVIVNTLIKGRRATTIRPKKRKFLKWNGPKGPVFAKEVHQPARRGNNFPATAWRNAENARRRMIRKIGQLTVNKVSGR